MNIFIHLFRIVQQVCKNIPGTIATICDAMECPNLTRARLISLRADFNFLSVLGKTNQKTYQQRYANCYRQDPGRFKHGFLANVKLDDRAGKDVPAVTGGDTDNNSIISPLDQTHGPVSL